MSPYQSFIFDSYDFSDKTLTLRYAIDDKLHFTETFRFDFDFIEYDAAALDTAIQLLWLVAGVSYYKTYLPPEIDTNNARVDSLTSSFLQETYQKGLGEFFYVNNLAPNSQCTFPVNADPLTQMTVNNVHDGLLVGVGGGKDSLVSAEFLRDSHPNVATWSLNHRRQLEPLVKRIGLPHFFVERTWDSQLSELNKQGAYNGHVPISAIIACVGTIVGLLTGYTDHVVSNENSANEPSLTYRGVAINHQYSKSISFEHRFQRLLGLTYKNGPWYFSSLRPFSELRIAELFVTKGWFHKYKGVFSSCNRAFTQNQNTLFWCGECAKCAFVFLILAPFADRAELEALWHDKNLLMDSKLESTYCQLLGIEGDKPLDCVGEVQEARVAMRMAQELYPELQKYEFEIDEAYDFRTMREHAMSEKIYALIESRSKN